MAHRPTTLGAKVCDELLVLESQLGHSEALGQLVERWQARLSAHAYRLTGDEEGAREVTQDAWLAIVRGIRGLADPARFRAWALQIVTRRAADWVRKVQRRRRLERPAEIGGERLNPGADSIDQEGSEDGQDVRHALGQLPADRRALLALFYSQELSIEEIATVLGVPRGTVKSRLFHARQQLKATLQRNRS